MRRFQFWLLVLGSTLVSLLMVKQIFLSRALNHEQGILIDSQETAATAQTYQSAWQKLAMAIYGASPHDPELAAVLKGANVEIHTKPTDAPAGSTPSDSTTPSGLMSTPPTPQ